MNDPRTPEPAAERRALRDYFRLGFPISLEAGERFELLPLLGKTVAADDRHDLGDVRDLTHRVNLKRPPTQRDEPPLAAKLLVTLGVINDAMRHVIRHYCLADQPGVLDDAWEAAGAVLGRESLETLPPVFVHLFPPRPVLALETAPDHWLAGPRQEGTPRDRILIETVVLFLDAQNPGARGLRLLFDDAQLQQRAPYVPFVVGLERFLEEREPVADTGEDLFHFLRGPLRASPDDLAGQLAFIRERWSALLPEHLRRRLQLAADVWQEDDQPRGLGPGPVPVLEFGAAAEYRDVEPERFSHDADWMSNVVLMAKSTHVWLDQLSRRYGRPLTRLSDIPDEELDRLARWGFRGLWLIGLWERSRASRRIKQWMGNPEAAASAYSLHDYAVAAELGGEEAWRDLNERARRRGIRLASDMVPNHMGIDSRWVIEHPHWFLQAPLSPYPWYTFGGGDVSDDPRVGLYLEDGYWEHRDAAVVFRRVDRATGEERFIYHGNDGTSMPWNDTAQLNYLLPEVREAVIRTILHVARMFPIIRFDAAMTLARKHYQRLWFPAPGDAGAIPSRAEQGMSRDDFAVAFGGEFWREVVDRVAAEAPDTLLLAEAFWLMEGYFVRTLGMHRVYNSAFMNMLKMEENRKYRQTIKNVLEFSPEVLKRFVNFMNNPDERTAIEQFGKGDKYFGVATMMVTMPGLPMFGHGQIEGLAEKYGMEYRRAYWDEQVDAEMVRRHEREIFPLMRRRPLFSGAANFHLFDFETGGGVNENVFAYTNRHGEERALVMYNNAYESTAGRIALSSAVNVGRADEPYLVRRTLAEALGLSGAPDVWYAFREHRSGMWHLRRGEEFVRDGVYAELGGYQTVVLAEWRELRDEDGRWSRLAAWLGGRGAADLETARREMELEPVHRAYRDLLSPEFLDDAGAWDAGRRERWRRAWRKFLSLAAAETGADPVDHESIAAEALRQRMSLGACDAWAAIWVVMDRLGELKRASTGDDDRAEAVDAAPPSREHPGAAREVVERLLLAAPSLEILEGGGEVPQAARETASLILALLAHGNLLTSLDDEFTNLCTDFFEDHAIRTFLHVHPHAGRLWLNKERLERLLDALTVLAGAEDLPPARARAARERAARIAALAARSGYELDPLLAALAG